MAEVKNAFIKSKMNKDLDDRLIPSGEYRDALNIQVSKSEASDVGALENILGNSVEVDFGAIVSVNGLKCIGFFVDEFKNELFSFFTNYTDSSNSIITYSPSAENFIFRHNINTLDTTVLVRGAFLNFSTTSPIIGVNLLEELLFFTDNRNQPRKINVNLANLDSSNITPSYYFNEDQISVATYNPYECIRVVKASDQTGAVLVSTVLTSDSSSKVLTVLSPALVQIGAGVIGTGVKTGTVVLAINGNDITVNKTQNLFTGDIVEFVGLETSMYNVSSQYLYNEPGVEADLNPYYDSSFGGDPDFLEDKFPRFSYRFQFIDGENSIYAPFTQPCFIPKQDGYFLENFNGDTDEAQTFQTTIVDFMENKVTQIKLQIPLPAYASELASVNSPFKIKAIDILYKESDGLAVQVVDTIIVDAAFGIAAGQNNVYEYIYESTKPFKTLPSAELIRVYDKIPVRAFSQEIISNRVVYGNFQDKHTPPDSINYQVNVSDKYPRNSLNGNKTIVEYPNSSVKQNRNYQVGIVLSDKFGRQSSTILSNNTSSLTATGFGAATVFSAYQTEQDTSPGLWPGDSLKILFNEAILSEKNLSTGAPGLYNGDPTSSNYNPLGWYSYKVVVQQKQQDYYNVYNAGAMKGSPTNVAQNISTSYISLINDNINKVPRDLSEVGPQQRQFRSSVRLIARVENTAYTTSTILDPAGNRQFYPGALTDTTSAIENLYGIFNVDGYIAENSTKPIFSDQNPFYPFYKSESNPFVAQITTTQNGGFGLSNTPMGSPAVYLPIENLAIFETEPDLSRLDIYWETSTSGLISDLNLAIAVDAGGAYAMDNWNFAQTEASNIGDIVVSNFYPTDIANVPIPSSTMQLIAVRDVNNNPRNISEWTLEPLGVISGRNEYNLKSNAYQYYGPGANNNQSWVFTFRVTDTTASPITTDLVETGQLINIAPTIAGGANQTITAQSGTTGVFNTQTAVNGAIAAGGQSTQNLTWSKVTGASNFTINATSGQLSNSSSSAGGSFIVVIRVTDAGGLTDEATLNIVFGSEPVPSQFIIPETVVGDFGNSEGASLTWYFTNPNSSGGYNNLDGPGNIMASGYIQPTDPSSTPTSIANPKGGYICSNIPDGFDNFLWDKERKGNWLQGGNNATFYVAISNTTFGNPVTRTAATVEWRNLSFSSEWQPARDINGQLVNFGQTLQDATTGFQQEIRYIPLAGSNLGKLQTGQIPGYTSLPYQYQVQNSGGVNSGYRIFAFNGSQNGYVDGEYRITVGNFTGEGFGYSASNPCGAVNSQSQSLQSITMGDANYGGPNVSSGYEYKVSAADTNVTCSAVWDTSLTFYAREFIAKYVTQLYTDAAMTIPASFPAERVRKFIINGVNQEGYNNGQYLAKFNINGLRTTASIGCIG